MTVRRGRVPAALLLAGMIAGCGASSDWSAGSQYAGPPGTKALQGVVLSPAKAAPALSLRDYTGRWVSLAAMRGRAVLVTFVYTHCPHVCPVIVSNLAAAQRELGTEARHLSILAVTVDPRRDTPRAVRGFLAAHGATGRVDYLLGSEAQLRRTWKAWDVGIHVDTRDVTVGHTSIVYGIDASGKIAVVYPENFTPAQIVHDVPLLARA